MATPQAVWEILKVVHAHPRFRIGFWSLAGCATLRYTIWNLYLYWSTKKKISERKKLADQRKQLVKEHCANSVPDGILNKPVIDLIKDLKSGVLTAVQVLNAFQKKALELDESFHMITEPIPEALDQAKELDQASDKTGLLHGFPISVKENIGIIGYDTTGGMSFFVNKLKEEDSVVVKVLKRHGAIPFVRTNIPQTMMSYCSSNLIYGETSNPLDSTRGPGGSSSGEGSLIGAGGSFMGIGTDIGGSIRVPAAFCGCYSLKTTNKRVSYKGLVEVSKGNLALQSNACPITKDWESLVLLSKALMSEEMYELDPNLPIMPFSQERLDKSEPMCIGYYTFDGNVNCQPAVIRAVMESKAALEKMGHTLVPIDLSVMSPPGYDNVQLFGKVAGSDRFQRYKELMANEKHEQGIKLSLKLFSLPPWLLRVLSFLISFKDKYASRILLGTIGFKSVHLYLKHIEKMRLWQDQFMNSWQKMKLDAIICPVFPSAAPKKEYMHLLTGAVSYCQLYNTLNYPAGVLPVTKVTKDDVQKTMDPSVHKPSSMIEKLLLKSVEGSEGMPIAVQCVALPFREETCLRVMKEVETGLQE